MRKGVWMAAATTASGSQYSYCPTARTAARLRPAACLTAAVAAATCTTGLLVRGYVHLPERYYS